MAKAALGALLGMVTGAVVLLLLTKIGDPPGLYWPGMNGRQTFVNYGGLVSQFAMIVGAGAGAIAGAIVGSTKSSHVQPFDHRTER